MARCCCATPAAPSTPAMSGCLDWRARCLDQEARSAGRKDLAGDRTRDEATKGPVNCAQEQATRRRIRTPRFAAGAARNAAGPRGGGENELVRARRDCKVPSVRESDAAGGHRGGQGAFGVRDRGLSCHATPDCTASPASERGLAHARRGHPGQHVGPNGRRSGAGRPLCPRPREHAVSVALARLQCATSPASCADIELGRGRMPIGGTPWRRGGRGAERSWPRAWSCARPPIALQRAGARDRRWPSRLATPAGPEIRGQSRPQWQRRRKAGRPGAARTHGLSGQGSLLTGQTCNERPSPAVSPPCRACPQWRSRPPQERPQCADA